MSPQAFIVNQTMIIRIAHHALFYVKSIQVKHRQRTQKERERAIAEWGERDRMETEREYCVGFIEDSYFWF